FKISRSAGPGKVTAQRATVHLQRAVPSCDASAGVRRVVIPEEITAHESGGNLVVQVSPDLVVGHDAVFNRHGCMIVDANAALALRDDETIEHSVGQRRV